MTQNYKGLLNLVIEILKADVNRGKKSLLNSNTLLFNDLNIVLKSIQRPSIINKDGTSNDDEISKDNVEIEQNFVIIKNLLTIVNKNKLLSSQTKISTLEELNSIIEAYDTFKKDNIVKTSEGKVITKEKLEADKLQNAFSALLDIVLESFQKKVGRKSIYNEFKDSNPKVVANFEASLRAFLQKNAEELRTYATKVEVEDKDDPSKLKMLEYNTNFNDLESSRRSLNRLISTKNNLKSELDTIKNGKEGILIKNGMQALSNPNLIIKKRKDKIDEISLEEDVNTSKKISIIKPKEEEVIDKKNVKNLTKDLKDKKNNFKVKVLELAKVDLKQGYGIDIENNANYMSILDKKFNKLYKEINTSVDLGVSDVNKVYNSVLVSITKDLFNLKDLETDSTVFVLNFKADLLKILMDRLNVQSKVSNYGLFRPGDFNNKAYSTLINKVINNYTTGISSSDLYDRILFNFKDLLPLLIDFSGFLTNNNIKHKRLSDKEVTDLIKTQNQLGLLTPKIEQQETKEDLVLPVEESIIVKPEVTTVKRARKTTNTDTLKPKIGEGKAPVQKIITPANSEILETELSQPVVEPVKVEVKEPVKPTVVESKVPKVRVPIKREPVKLVEETKVSTQDKDNVVLSNYVNRLAAYILDENNERWESSLFTYPSSDITNVIKNVILTSSYYKNPNGLLQDAKNDKDFVDLKDIYESEYRHEVDKAILKDFIDELYSLGKVYNNLYDYIKDVIEKKLNILNFDSIKFNIDILNFLTKSLLESYIPVKSDKTISVFISSIKKYIRDDLSKVYENSPEYKAYKNRNVNVLDSLDTDDEDTTPIVSNEIQEEPDLGETKKTESNVVTKTDIKEVEEIIDEEIIIEKKSVGVDTKIKKIEEKIGELTDRKEDLELSINPESIDDELTETEVNQLISKTKKSIEDIDKKIQKLEKDLIDLQKDKKK